MKALLAIITVFTLAGCGLVFGPGYKSTDTHYFEEPPVVVKNGSQYFLRWHYGSMGFYFYPEYKVRNGALVFSLQGTSSTGNRSGYEQTLMIEGDAEIEALKTGGAYWWEPDGSLTPLAITEETGL